MENKTYARILIILGIVGLFALLYTSVSAVTVCQIGNGCTGTSTAPAYGGILIGGKNGEYEFVASSTFGGGGGGGSSFSTTSAAYWFTQQTTSGLAEGSNLYFTNARAVAALTGQNVSIFANDAGYITPSVFNTDFDTRLTATTTLPKITTLAGLSLPYSQLTGTPDLSGYFTLASWFATTSAPQITTLSHLSLPYTQLTGTPDLTQYLKLSDWYATTTDQLREGSTNLYFTNARADARFVTDLAATTSVKSITTLPSLSLPYSQLTGTPTFASSTLLADNNTFSGNDTFNNTITGSVSGNAGTATALQNARTINNVSFNGTANITINAASSTLLGDKNTWSALNVFSNATSTLFSATNGWITFASSTQVTASTGFCIGSSCITSWPTTGASTTLLSDNNTFSGIDNFNKLLQLSATTSALLATDASGNVISTTSVGSNYITGQLLTVNGTSFNRGDSKTITAASSTALSDHNTFTASTTFQNQLNLQGASSTILSAANIWDGALSSGDCVQAGTGGLLTTTAGACGSAGGGITALGNYATTTGTAISLSTSTETTNGVTQGLTIAVSANGILFTPTISGTLSNTGLAHATIVVNGTTLTLGDSADTITAASSTLLSNNNTFSGNDTFSNLISGSINGNANTATALAANGTNCASGFFALGIDASGNAEGCTYAVSTTTPWSANQFVVTNSAGVEYSVASSSLDLPNTALQHSSIVVNGTTFNLGDTHTITAASSTLLASDNNTFSGNTVFSASTTIGAQLNAQNASTTELQTGTFWNTGITSALGLFDANHKETAYAGSSNPCSANQAPTTLSAVGALGGCTSTFLTTAVTSVAANNGITGGTITTTGTLSLDQTFGAVWTAASSTYTGHLALNTASTTQFSSPTIWDSTVGNALWLGDANGKATAYGGAAACTNQFVTAISALGATTCATVANAALAHSTIVVNSTTLTLGDAADTITAASSTLLSNNNTFSGTDNFSGTFQIGGTSVALPISIANGGTGLSSIGASSTVLTTNGSASTWQLLNLGAAVYGTLPAGNGGTGATSLSSAYTVSSNVLSNVVYPSFSVSTSTTWTGTTTIPLGPASVNETWNNVKCFTDAGTLNVDFYYGATPTHLALFNASTTIGTVTWTTNNTPQAGNIRKVDIGTPSGSPTVLSCTVQKTI